MKKKHLKTILYLIFNDKCFRNSAPPSIGPIKEPKCIPLSQSAEMDALKVCVSGNPWSLNDMKFMKSYLEYEVNLMRNAYLASFSMRRKHDTYTAPAQTSPESQLQIIIIH